MNTLRKAQRGFSLIEIVVVMAIMLAVAAVALPNFTTFTSTYKLRSALQQTSGVLQQLRMEAVRKNATLNLSTATSSARTVLYADLDGNTTWQSNEPSAMFPANVSVTSTGHPGDATTGLSYTPETTAGALPRFNARGLPTYGNNTVGFVMYVKNLNTLGGATWGAITITPAGRVRTWLWNGSAYSGL